MKDITKDSFTASYKREKSNSTTTTYTTKETETQSSTYGANCLCPSNIPNNSYCTFRFSYLKSTSWADVQWNGEENSGARDEDDLSKMFLA